MIIHYLKTSDGLEEPFYINYVTDGFAIILLYTSRIETGEVNLQESIIVFLLLLEATKS